MNKPQSPESHMKSFNITIDFWMEYPFFTINPVFLMNINDEFDKKELYDLKLLYELKTRAGANLVDYGFKYALKHTEIIEILSSPIDYKTINELVKIARNNYNIVMVPKKTKILMSIKSNESIILLEKKVTAYYSELLLMVKLLCNTIDPKYINLLGLRDVCTIEDLYKMYNCVHAGLKKIELELTKSMNRLRENKELAQDEIKEKTKIYEKKIEAVQEAIKHFDTWKIEEEEIKKLHSFQIEHIIDKLREEDIIAYPWPQYIEENEDLKITKIEMTKSSANSLLELKQNSQDENKDHQLAKDETVWLSTNCLVLIILFQILLICFGIVLVVYKQEIAGCVSSFTLK